MKSNIIDLKINFSTFPPLMVTIIMILMVNS